MDLGEAVAGISRRGFLFGSAAAVGTMAGCRIVGAGDGVDPCLTAFLSDIHVSGLDVQGQPTYQNPLFERAVDAVLAMRPLPARVVVMGDIALWKGRHEDYEASLPALKRIKVACLPSTGWWGDIGFATLRTFSDRAELTMAPGNDFFFPNPLKPGEARPAAWDEIRAEHANAHCTFAY